MALSVDDKEFTDGPTRKRDGTGESFDTYS